jgi:hypothetical protein
MWISREVFKLSLWTTIIFYAFAILWYFIRRDRFHITQIFPSLVTVVIDCNWRNIVNHSFLEHFLSHQFQKSMAPQVVVTDIGIVIVAFRMMWLLMKDSIKKSLAIRASGYYPGLALEDSGSRRDVFQNIVERVFGFETKPISPACLLNIFPFIFTALADMCYVLINPTFHDVSINVTQAECSQVMNFSQNIECGVRGLYFGAFCLPLDFLYANQRQLSSEY